MPKESTTGRRGLFWNIVLGSEHPGEEGTRQLKEAGPFFSALRDRGQERLCSASVALFGGWAHTYLSCRPSLSINVIHIIPLRHLWRPTNPAQVFRKRVSWVILDPAKMMDMLSFGQCYTLGWAAAVGV